MRSSGGQNERAGPSEGSITFPLASGLDQGSSQVEARATIPPRFESAILKGTGPIIPMVIEETLLTPRDVAKMLRVPVSWIYERTRRRGIEQLPHLKIGKYLRFRKEDILGWLDEYKI